MATIDYSVIGVGENGKLQVKFINPYVGFGDVSLPVDAPRK
jgi:hypothetical protein